MANIIYQGNTAGSFRGFKKDKLFKMDNGTYWIQAQYEYWYYYEYRPEAVISEENGVYILTVAGHSIPVRRISDVVESRIIGAFKGWDGKTAYKLTNGQVWKQTTYKYEYKYAYNPEAVVFYDRGIYKMIVEDTEAEVRRA